MPCFYGISYLYRDRLRWREKGNWRRERDSNPRRAFDPYTLSRGAPSTTRPSLLAAQSYARRSGRAKYRQRRQKSALAWCRLGRLAFDPVEDLLALHRDTLRSVDTQSHLIA